MKKYFTAEALNEIRRNISSSLMDTFQMMFQLDVFLLPKLSSSDDEPMISAYIDLAYKGDKAVLSIDIGHDLVEYLAHQMDPSTPVPSREIVQDIVCEITNIVGNHLRTYVYNKIDIELDLSLPKQGHPGPETENVPAVNLHFRIREHDTLKLAFGYAENLQHTAI